MTEPRYTVNEAAEALDGAKLDDHAERLACADCGQLAKTYPVFGKWKCKPCIEARKTGVKGSSGMVYQPGLGVALSLFNEGLWLERVKKSNGLFVKWYIEHYPQSKGIPGRSLNYLIYFGHEPIGIISGASPPRNYKIFREYFNVEDDLEFLNNVVFRIVDKPNDNNIGTKILKLFRTTVRDDYRSKYEAALMGLVTFVEPPRTGAIYKADNWENLGLTKGFSARRGGKDWYAKTFSAGEKKLIYGYKYQKRVNAGCPLDAPSKGESQEHPLEPAP